jgi:hypothetical protein
MWAEEELSYSDGPDVLMLRYALVRHHLIDRVIVDHGILLHDCILSEASPHAKAILGLMRRRSLVISTNDTLVSRLYKEKKHLSPLL